MGSDGNSSLDIVEWPELYIIGAPKCGTTALARYLSEHPDVNFSKIKEPHYFATDLPNQRLVDAGQEYLSLFAEEHESGQVRAEGSVWYLYSAEAVPRILALRPDAKFVIMLRNPVDTAYALHSEKLKSLDENVMQFEDAFRLQDQRRQGINIPARCREPKTILYGDACKFGEQLERFYQHVSADRAKVVLYDDFCADPQLIYREVLHHAGLDDDGRQSFERINQSARVRSDFLNRLSRRPSLVRQRITRPLKRALGVHSLGVSAAINKLNIVAAERPPLSPDFQAELQDYFFDDVVRLSKILGRELKAWLSPTRLQGYS